MVDNSQISTWLYQTLDCIGVSQRMRELYQRNSQTIEVLHNIWFQGDVPCFVFGSSSEGTTTPGLDSDLDIVIPYDRMPIVDCIDDCPETGWSVLMISDVENSPGYVRLQLVIDRKPVTTDDMNEVPLEYRNLLTEDKLGRLIFGGHSIFAPMMELSRIAYRHGPAVTTKHSNFISSDLIYAHRCKFWPSVAKEWIERNRNFGWPSTDAIEELQNYGFLLVYIDHPNSCEKHFECRISFSFQERKLMHRLNETQFKCYVFLKIIKNDFIETVVEDSVTSYFLKTCLFYTIENNLQDIWRPDNLWNCIIKCLNLLLQWVDDRFCPNYFIPKANMFLGKVEGDTRKTIKAILHQLINGGAGFLHNIKTDDIGKYFSYVDDYFEAQKIKIESEISIALKMYQFEYLTASEFFNIFLTILHELSTYDEDEEHLTPMCHKNTYRVAINHEKLLNIVDKVSMGKDHTVQETQMALNILKPFLQTSLACHYASLAFYTEDEKRKQDYLAKSYQQFEIGLNSDLTSSRLKYATFLYKLGEYGKCEEQLKIVQRQCEDCILLVSKLRTLELRTINEEVLMNKKHTYDGDFKKCSSFPVIFLPTEGVMVPDSLVFEIFRSFGTPANTCSEELDFWYDWAMVDSTSYLYFLWYLVNKKMGKPSEDCTVKLISLYQNVNSVWAQSHRETVCNLIAWILVSENKFPQAFDALKMSVCEMERFEIGHEIGLCKLYVKHHNAAKWNILLILFKLWKLKGHTVDLAENLCFNCLNLGNFVLKTCVRCEKAKYCSKECQKNDWNLHKYMCNKPEKFGLAS